MQPVTWLAEYANDRPSFLAAALGDYSRSAGLDDAGLASALGCDLDTLVLIKLCLRPRAESEFFRSEVEQIAARFNVSADVLASIVRRSDAMARLRQAHTSQRGVLIAARDREGLTLDRGGDSAPVQ